MTARLPAVVLGVAAAALSCAGNEPQPGTAAAARRPHIVLVVVDTLRADALGFLGSEHGTPRLDRLADESIVFTQAIAPSTWTLPSMASLMTSLHPSEHGLLGGGEGDEQLPQVLDEAYVTLAESLQQGGYRTVGIVNQIYLQWKFGFGQGFDHYQGLRGHDGIRINRRLDRELARQEAGVPTVAGAAATSGTAADAGPLFLYLHYLDPHWPYNHRVDDPVPPALAAADEDPGLPRAPEAAAAWVAEQGDAELRRRAVETLAARYTLEVRWIDAVLGGLIDLLESRSLWDDTILVVTSDHGEGFWEHERLLHGHTPYEEQIRVPLLVRAPPALGFPVGRRTEPVGLIDLMPTLLELAGLPIPEHCRGESLLEALRGREDAERALLVDTGRERALRTRDAKLLVRRGNGRRGDGHRGVDDEGGTPAVEFYDLAADPGESRNLASPCEGRCRDSARRLQEMERGLTSPGGGPEGAGEVTAEEIEELRSLGYVGD